MVGQPDAVSGLVEGVAGRVGWEPVRVLVTEPQPRLDSEPTPRDLSEALVAVYRTDFRVLSPTCTSRFNDMTRQAAAYRDRRVLPAGDAAHMHPPVEVLVPSNRTYVSRS